MNSLRKTEKPTKRNGRYRHFVKYGALSDDKFYDKAKEFLLLGNTSKETYTLEEYSIKVKDFQTDKDGQLVYLYTPDPEGQDSYIQAAIKKAMTCC